MELSKELSERETIMFTDLGWSYLFHVTDIPIRALYNMAIEKAFIENKQGPEVEALRRASKHMRNKYRGNAEFEKLIHYDK